MGSGNANSPGTGAEMWLPLRAGKEGEGRWEQEYGLWS